MKKILLHAFAVCMLTNFVSEDVHKCFQFKISAELYGLEQVNTIEDDSPIKSFRTIDTDFHLYLIHHPVTSCNDVSELYLKPLHTCAGLSIFSPPPNFC